jgi:hypothetical protein
VPVITGLTLPDEAKQTACLICEVLGWQQCLKTQKKFSGKISGEVWNCHDSKFVK